MSSTALVSSFSQAQIQSMRSLYATLPLPVLVKALLDQLIIQSKEFTAYDVTLALRAVFPETEKEILHVSGVREEVHLQMDPYLQNGLYQRRMESFDGSTSAFLYYPTSSLPSSSIIPSPPSSWGGVSMTPRKKIKNISSVKSKGLPRGVWILADDALSGS